MNLAAILSLYFALKVVIAGAYAGKIRAIAGSWPMAIALSWVALHLGLNGLMLALSLFNALDGIPVWIFLGLALLLAYRPTEIFQFDQTNPSIGFLPSATGLVALAVFGFLLYRSLYFFDTTWDALAYELPRISMYVEAKSLFVQHTAGGLNIFANEWNGEPLALLARLACGSDQAIGFGGAETWLWGWIALFAAARHLGAAAVYAALIALLLMTTPAVLGLAMVVKSDLLAAVALCLGIACLAPRPAENAGFWLVSGSMILAFVAGVNVTVLPLAVLLLVYAGFKLGWNRRTRGWLPLVALLCALGTARYLVNTVVYPDPVKRVDAEQAAPDFSTLKENIAGVAAKCFDTVSWPWAVNSERGALGLGFGAVGCVALLSVPLFLLKRKNSSPHWQKPGFPLILFFVLCWVYVAWNVRWHPWAFRYHLPWTMPVALFALVAGACRLTSRQASVTGSALLLATIIQAVYACRVSEVRFGSFLEARSRSQLERKVAFNINMVSPQLQSFASSPAMNVTIFNQLNSAILPFFGDDSRHRVQLVASADALLASAQGAIDAVVLSGPKTAEYALISARLQHLGFNETIDNIFFRLWRKPTRVEPARESAAHP